jgi:hypothetical protein
MKKLILKAFLILIVFIPVSALAEAGVHVKFPLPPPIIFPAPPGVVVIPGMDVYTVPDMQEEIFFSGGWWWRPWQGRWYRSRYYDRGWGYYRGAPGFYRNLYPGWRDDYRSHRWRGQPWNYQRVPHHDLNRNWREWERNGHWRHDGPGGPGPGVHRGGGPGGPGGPDGPRHHGDERR